MTLPNWPRACGQASNLLITGIHAYCYLSSNALFYIIQTCAVHGGRGAG